MKSFRFLCDSSGESTARCCIAQIMLVGAKSQQRIRFQVETCLWKVYHKKHKKQIEKCVASETLSTTVSSNTKRMLCGLFHIILLQMYPYGKMIDDGFDALKSISTMERDDGGALASGTVNYFTISSPRIKKIHVNGPLIHVLADERSTRGVEKLLTSLTNLDILMIVH